MSVGLDWKTYDSRFLLPASNGIKIAFVQPKIPDGNYLPNLGIMILAALLLRRGYEVKIFDENLDPDCFKNILQFAPDCAGFTCVTATVDLAAECALRLKGFLPNLVTVVGGPHVSAVPKETIERYQGFDYAINGEAEKTFLQFCESLFIKRSRSIAESTSGLVFRIDDTVKMNPPGTFLEGAELDELPFPAWHLLPMEMIFSKVTHGLFSKGKRIMPVMTTRGCPNYCGFCCRVMGFKFRGHNIKRVLTEIQWLYDQYKIDEVYFEDDTFTQDPDRAHALLDGVIGLKLPIYVKFANGLRADKVDFALLSKMKEAGVYWVGFGIESGSPHTQKLMFKFLDLDLAVKNVQLAKSMGFKVGSNCIIGYPGETKESIRESVRFFLDLKLDSLAVVNCVPFPGTTAWQVCEKNGWFTERAKDYRNYWFEVFKVSPLIETPTLSARDLSRLIFLTYIRFYFLNAARFFLISKMVLKKVRSSSWLTPDRWVRFLRGNIRSDITKAS